MLFCGYKLKRFVNPIFRLEKKEEKFLYNTLKREIKSTKAKKMLKFAVVMLLIGSAFAEEVFKWESIPGKLKFSRNYIIILKTIY